MGCLVHNQSCIWMYAAKLNYHAINALPGLCAKSNLIRRRIISCSYSTEKLYIPSKEQLKDARVVYSIAASVGHNKESHPESNLRVQAIVGALEKMELTSKVYYPKAP